MSAIENALLSLKDFGVYDILLPFILVFTVTFAIMDKVKVFDERKINGTIAFVLGLATIFPHVLWGTPDPTDAILTSGLVDIVEVMNNALPNISVVVIAILMALLIVGVMGKRITLGDNSLSGWVAFLAFVIVAYIFGSKAGWWSFPGFLRSLNNPDTLALVLVILVFAIVIWLVTRESDKERMTKEKFGDKFAKLLGGGE
ncbi:MAG: hypothetical protein OXR66_05430 [Candidatus Woesearchaeota archaeon]|nr:hypothetical protein [Candidatus Woesearchaeota archaeon]